MFERKRSYIITALGVILGNTIAWADFALYAYFSPILSQVFFSFTDKATAYILYFIVFALSFLFRPLGSAISGAYADKHGRKKTLVFIVIFSSMLTACIGLLPSYKTIGFLSPFLLAVLRILQTMAIASEPTNSGSLLIEHSAWKHKGLVTSFVMVGIFLGFLLGIIAFLVISYYLTPSQILEGGWRIPYLIFLPIGLLSSYLITFSTESPVYLMHQKRNELSKNPIRDAIFKYPKAIFFAFGLSIMMAAGNYFLLGTIPEYLVSIIRLPLFEANLAITIGLVFTVVLIPIMGYLSDIWGRKLIAALGSIGFVIFMLPILWLILTGKMINIVLGIVIFCILLAPVSAVLPVILAEMFPFAVRCTAGALGYNIALVLFGGTTPLFIQLMLNVKTDQRHNELFHPFLYMSLIAIIHLFFIYYSKETSDKDIAK